MWYCIIVEEGTFDYYYYPSALLLIHSPQTIRVTLILNSLFSITLLDAICLIPGHTVATAASGVVGVVGPVQ